MSEEHERNEVERFSMPPERWGLFEIDEVGFGLSKNGNTNMKVVATFIEEGPDNGAKMFLTMPIAFHVGLSQIKPLVKSVTGKDASLISTDYLNDVGNQELVVGELTGKRFGADVYHEEGSDGNTYPRARAFCAERSVEYFKAEEEAARATEPTPLVANEEDVPF